VYNGTALAGNASMTSFTVSGVSANTSTFSVKAKNAAGNISASSNNLTVRTLANNTAPPVPLVSLSSNENTGTSITNSGSLGGSLVRTSPTPARSTNVPATVGGTSSLDFGTTGNFAVESSTPIGGLTNLPAFTITGWLNNGAGGVYLVYNSNGSLQLSVDQWPDNLPTGSSAGKVPANASAPASNWVFFAASYSSTAGEVKLYFGNAGNASFYQIPWATRFGI
jgi:hypothetical protein